MENKVINTLIDELYELVQDARNLPLSADKCILERDAILDMLDEIIAALPTEIKKANKIISSRDELLNNAQKEAEAVISNSQTQATNTIASANKEAENIVAKAKAQAQELVTKEAIYQETEKQCKDMVDKTNAQITELRTVSNKYIADSLSKAAETIEASLKDINTTRSKFEILTADKELDYINNKSFNAIDINLD